MGTGFGQQICQRIEQRQQHSTSIYPVLSELMTLLPALVARLGSLEEWPSTVLRQLFDEPTFHNVESVASFFCGNGAPCSLCSQSFHACNAAATGTSTDYIYKLYDSWQGNRSGIGCLYITISKVRGTYASTDGEGISLKWPAHLGEDANWGSRPLDILTSLKSVYNIYMTRGSCIINTVTCRLSAASPPTRNSFPSGFPIEI